ERNTRASEQAMCNARHRSDRSWNADRWLDRRCKISRVARRESQLCPLSPAALCLDS
ncbi:hypothetical protein ALC60_09006, partial [Trachymyrmex zeteki]